MEQEETSKQRINRLAREWYARNKERIKEKKLTQCHTYRRRMRVGRPPREVAKPERVMIVNMETGEMNRAKEPPEPEAKDRVRTRTRTQTSREEAETKIEPGSFLISFN